MSGTVGMLISAATAGTSPLLTSGAVSVFLTNQRSINSDSASLIIPDVTVEETLDDRLMVTQHPVARGSPVSDHAYKLPSTVTMRCGWSNAGHGLDGFTEQRIITIYNQLRTLQFNQAAWDSGTSPAVTPFTLTTGKRTYQNMVIAELSVRTDKATEFALMVECHFQEVLIADLGTTTQPAISDMASPDKTSASTDQPGKTVAPTGPMETPFQKAIDLLNGV